MSIIPLDRGYKVEQQNYSLIYEDTVYEDDYYSGSSMQMMKPNVHHLLKHGHDQSHGHVYGGYDEGRKGHESNLTEHYRTNHHLPKHGHDQNHGGVYGGYDEGRKGHESNATEHYRTNHHLPKHGHDQNHGGVYGGYDEGRKGHESNATEHYRTNHHLPKHGHDQNHGRVYGGYDEKGRKGHESHMTEHYEAWEEEDWRHDSWNMKNDHYAHGGNKHYNGEYPRKEGGMKYGGYGDKQGHFGPHKEFIEHHHEERMRAPVWEFKGIID